MAKVYGGTESEKEEAMESKREGYGSKHLSSKHGSKRTGKKHAGHKR